MSQDPTPDVFEGTVQPAREDLVNEHPLSPEKVEDVLGAFRTWVMQAATDSPEGVSAAEGPPAVEERPDLYTMLEHFTALRHEINLQTKATRAQQEQNAQTLEEFLGVVEKLEANQPTPEQDEATRPLLQTIIGLYDSLALAAREVRRVQQVTLPELKKLQDTVEEFENSRRQQEVTKAPAEPDPNEEPVWVMPIEFEEDTEPAEPAPSFWSRFLGRSSAPRKTEEVPSISRTQQSPSVPSNTPTPTQSPEPEPPDFVGPVGEAVTRVEQLLTSVVTGYTMSVDRIDRALEKHGLMPIPAVGQPFDPEVMEVLDVVTEPGRTTTEVIEEVRRGYKINGQVFRFAQVRVAKPS